MGSMRIARNRMGGSRRRRRRNGMLFRRSRILSAAFTLLVASLAVGFVSAQASPGVSQTFGAGNAATATSLSASAGSTTGAGDLLIATIKVRNTTALATVSSVTDDSGTNVWTKDAAVGQGQGDLEIWSTAGAVGVNTVTVTVTAASAIAFTVLDVAGAATNPRDQSATAAGSSTTPSVGPTGTTSQASELAVGVVAPNGTATISGETVGFTPAPVQKSTAIGEATSEEPAAEVLSATGTQTYGATLSTSAGWFAALVTYKLGAGPTITNVNPPSGPDGTSVTITGTKLSGATAVTFNGTPATTFNSVDDFTVTATVPTGATSGPITVMAAAGTATSPNPFTVQPTITSFTPSSGPIGTPVTITGSGFTGVTTVTFNSVSATFSFTDDAHVTAYAPGGGSGTIILTTPGGSATSANSFTVTASPKPTITGFSPTTGPAGTSVTITGTGFTGASAVQFNGTTAVFSITDDLHITATVPFGATTGTITVTTSGGTAPSGSNFKVTTLPHVMVIVMENKAYNSANGSPYVIGSSNAPYINNTLVKNYTSATQWYANVHGSPLDYYALISGSTQAGNTKPYTGTTLVDELNAAKIPWKAYMETMPSNCYSGNPVGTYDPIHNPFAAFSDYKSLCTSGYGGVVPYNAPFSSSQLNTDLNSPTPPAFVWFTPNNCNDMHTSVSPCGSNGVANGDTWLSTFIPDVQSTTWYANGGTIIITWDESVNADSSGGTFGTGGHVVTLVISHHPHGAFTPSGDHFATLRGIEEDYGVGLLGSSANSSFGDLKPAF